MRCLDLKWSWVHCESNGDLYVHGVCSAKSLNIKKKKKKNRASVSALLLQVCLIQYFYCLYGHKFWNSCYTADGKHVSLLFNILLTWKHTTWEQIKILTVNILRSCHEDRKSAQSSDKEPSSCGKETHKHPKIEIRKRDEAVAEKYSPLGCIAKHKAEPIRICILKLV